MLLGAVVRIVAVQLALVYVPVLHPVFETETLGPLQLATRLLGRLLADLGPAGPDAEDLPDLRRVLYGLHAVLRLHFAREEEVYLPLFERPEEPGARAEGIRNG
jgi:hypothetical protein